MKNVVNFYTREIPRCILLFFLLFLHVICGVPHGFVVPSLGEMVPREPSNGTRGMGFFFGSWVSFGFRVGGWCSAAFLVAFCELMNCLQVGDTMQ